MKRDMQTLKTNIKEGDIKDNIQKKTKITKEDKGYGKRKEKN